MENRLRQREMGVAWEREMGVVWERGECLYPDQTVVTILHRDT